MKICIAAGGTGGHILPGLAAAKELRARGHRVHFILRTDAASQEFLAGEGFGSSAFFYAGFPRELSLKIFTFPFLTAAAYFNARRVLKREAPDVVLGMGGYISVPVGVAAARRKIPLFLHEQNSRAGLANRLLSRWARTVAVSFQKTQGLSKRVTQIWTGLPLRPDLVPQNPIEARKKLGLDPGAMTLLIFGGSQGARALNRLLISALQELPKARSWQFIHLTGQNDYQTVEKFYSSGGFRAFVKPFWNDMSAVYSAADFVVARSGANTVMELMRMGKKALLVPFPFATDNHQETNARWLEKTGAAHVLLERELSVEKIQWLLGSLPDKESLRRINAERLQSVAPDFTQAAGRLADLIEKV